MVKAQNSDAKSAEIEKVDGYDIETLGGLESFSDILNLADGNIESAADVLGYGFGLLEDKDRLLGIEFIIVRYEVHQSDKVKGKQFATIHVMTRSGDKFIVNDGSTGIMQQLAELKEKRNGGNICPLFVPRGLRASTYEYTDPATGQVSEATTYYLNTAK